jgi:hypothetical protein
MLARKMLFSEIRMTWKDLTDQCLAKIWNGRWHGYALVQSDMLRGIVDGLFYLVCWDDVLVVVDFR